MAGVELKITLVCRSCGFPWERTLRVPADVPPPDPSCLSSCVNCNQLSSMLQGMTPAEIMESKLARRVASELHLLPKRKERRAERLKKWRRGNRLWTRIYKMLRRAGLEITKAGAKYSMPRPASFWLQLWYPDSKVDGEKMSSARLFLYRIIYRSIRPKYSAQ
jgi:hypothetical protein